jgi:hypothetical protein
LKRKGPGNSNALPLTSTEFMGIAAHVIGSQTDIGQEFRHPLFPLLAIAHPVDIEGITDNVTDYYPSAYWRQWSFRAEHSSWMSIFSQKILLFILSSHQHQFELTPPFPIA